MKIMEIVKAQSEGLELAYETSYNMANGIELEQKELDVRWAKEVDLYKKLFNARENYMLKFWLGTIITNLNIKNWIIAVKIVALSLKLNRITKSRIKD